MRDEPLIYSTSLRLPSPQAAQFQRRLLAVVNEAGRQDAPVAPACTVGVMLARREVG